MAPSKASVQHASELLDQFTAQSQLRKALQVFLVQEDNEVALLNIVTDLASRIKAGVGRGVDNETAQAALAESSIAVQAAADALNTARVRYEARFGEVLPNTQLHVPDWSGRLPASADALIADMPAAAQLAYRQAWQRMQRADKVRALHEDRVRHLEQARDAFQQQFAIGQRMAVDLIQAQFSLRDAQAAALSAQAEALQAQAALMALLGRLQASDLLITPTTAAPAEPWLVDPDEPGRETLRRMRGMTQRQLAEKAPGSAELSRLFRDKPAVSAQPAPPPPTRSAGSGSITKASPNTPDIVFEAPPAGASPSGSTPGRRPPTAAEPDPTEDRLPSFPWPPAAASAEAPIPWNWLRPRTAAPTLGFAAAKLRDALKRASYSEYAFLGVPNGFAVISRMEQIQPDGKPSNPRWSRNINVPRVADVGLVGLIESLYKAPMGHYRVIVFVVTDAPRERSGQALGEAAMDDLLKRGRDELPATLAAKPYTERTKAVALIYEFAKASEQEAAKFVPNPPLDGKTHLSNAGILSELERDGEL
jgi:hypothetical protein